MTLVLVAALAAGQTAAGAEKGPEPVWALSFHDEVPEGACPGEEAMRALVGKQLGRDPFAASGAPGARSVSVRLFRKEHGIAGLVVWEDRGDTARRLIEERAGSCRAPVEAVAFAIVVRIQLAAAG